MFNSSVLEVAVGLIFTFLAISLATGAIVEALASVTTWRSRTLLTGVRQLVNDPNFTGLALQLYQHGLINPRGPGAPAPTKNMPAYIDPGQFANAMMDVLGLTGAAGSGAAAAPGGSFTATLTGAVNNAVPAAQNAQLNAMLQGIVQRSAGDVDKIHQELSKWFDNAMDRVSGTYKRHAQAAGLAVALVLSGICNIDALRVAHTLWVHPDLKVVASLAQNSPRAEEAIRTLQGAVPMGWPQPEFATTPKAAWLQALTGWLITSLATLFGAPFWFDALQGLVRLKGSGPSPAEKKSGQAAAS